MQAKSVSGPAPNGQRAGRFAPTTPAIGSTSNRPPPGTSTTLEGVELTGEYIAIRDTKRKVTRIPVYAIKSVKMLHGGF